MAEGDLRLGKVAFVDKGTFSTTVTYNTFNYVVTDDSCYLSIKDGNIGHAVAESDWWRCLANGKPATEAAKQALAKANEAAIASSNATAAAVRAGAAASVAGEQASVALAATVDANKAAEHAEDVASKGEAQISAMKAAEQSLMSQALLAPSRMELIYLKRITLGNLVVQKVVANLFPSYVLPNVLFLPAGGDSVAVTPIGGLTINGIGKSRIHVIPTHNTSIYRTIEIEVTNPVARKTIPSGLRLLSGGRIRKA